VPKPECQEKVFSSNACLFRHEREAHGLHEHGENPNLCWVSACERAKPGYGFPRKWNLGDHMMRVHNINMTDRHSSNASIITGAIRAHRHPERYGPHIGAAKSRAKGIARAMLETLPIIKFGDHQDLPVKPAGEVDIEMNAADTTRAGNAAAANQTSTTNATDTDPAAPTEDSASTSNSVESASITSGHMHNPDGTQDDGSLGCSICTEDFHKGEEVRVLPCIHKFHPECVDPWLLNISGTCPLCRIDLRPKDE
jgi:Ring finger domain